MSKKWWEIPCIVGKNRRQARDWRKILGYTGPLHFLHHCNISACREPRHIYLGEPADSARYAVDAETIKARAKAAVRRRQLEAMAERQQLYAEGARKTRGIVRRAYRGSR